jgi:tRNA threonylcarbamoyl adenosine modification protein YeaZ
LTQVLGAMRLLVIETAGKACSIALFADHKLIALREEEVGRGHAEALIPWIAELPDGGRADAVLVGCGPGSFTGVRVGIAAARGLGFGWGVPVLGMSSMALLAAGFEASKRFLVAVEGGHGELFVQTFDPSPLRPVGAMQSLTPLDASQMFDQEHVFGSGAERLVACRASGVAHSAQASAANAMKLDASLRSFPPKPEYGRGVDAKPAA